jgi:hypothetical protein
LKEFTKIYSRVTIKATNIKRVVKNLWVQQHKYNIILTTYFSANLAKQCLGTDKNKQHCSSISSLSKSWKGHTLIRTFFPWKSSVIIRAVSQGLGILYFCDSEFFLSLERTISQFCWGGNPAWWLYPYRWPPGSTGDSVELPALE